MKVLFCTIKGSLSGGTNIASMLLMKDLKKRGVDVHAVVSDTEFLHQLEQVGIVCHKVKVTPFFQWPYWESWKRFLYSPIQLLLNIFGTFITALSVLRISKKINPDFIETCNSPTLYGYFAAKWGGIPHVWHLREYLGLNVPIHVIPSNKYLKKCYLSNSYTISITSDVANYFECRNNLKDYVVNDGVLHENEIRYIEQKGNYFLFVGYVHPTKGCDDLFDAYLDYCKKGGNFELWIAGAFNDRYNEQLMSKVNPEIIEKGKIKFLGFRTDRLDLMSKAQATIVPSQKEGFGFITVEAIMNGCIVIGRNTGGTKMIMEEVKGGTIPFMSTEEMTKAMIEISNNGVLSYKELVLESQEIAKQKYSMEQCGYNVYSILQNLKKMRN